ncbi:helix-turn-helix domain-containing protein [Roseobacter sinensis]|uniref:Transcriptional repressor n=1 Tax=Roseobacter sinensis TaxID=2931391 RepID=A0ABT3BL95_9RHOB|nr:transcriptional repressor [Roseobacter sp. WL0113]MCV3274325.1 transcriptional repressor [Roseobacter sp. WL0113]
MAAIGFCAHDHTACVAEMMAHAEAHCAAEGLNFTPVRQRALEILLREHRALGAYDLLAQLAEDGLGSQPPVAYRALDFLVKAGLAHKIEALNAYVACVHSGAEHTPAFLICRGCRAVAEADTALTSGRLGEAAAAAGFHIERTVVEAQGLCPACQGPAP